MNIAEIIDRISVDNRFKNNESTYLVIIYKNMVKL